MSRRSRKHTATIALLAALLTSWLVAGCLFIVLTEKRLAADELKGHRPSSLDLESIYIDLAFAPFVIGGVAFLLALSLAVAWLWPPDGPFSEDVPPLHRL
ncbi:MAG: hypothetical protein AAF368_06555 [Planctomycetota bacterium]